MFKLVSREIFMTISLNLNRTVDYLRVSTTDQDIEKNQSAILALANDKSFGRTEFIEEYISG